MEYRLLGPLEVRNREESLTFAGGKRRALLALLLVNANRVVARDRLVDELWGDAPPATAFTIIQNHVSQLRKVLPEGTLRTQAPGYLLRVEPLALDSERFERLVEDAQGSDPDRAARLLREAVALWRGPPLAEFRDAPFARAEGGRLEELRLVALEAAVDAELKLGRHADLVGELEALILENPHRERLRGQLMLALYRSGRQAEALAAYRDARAALDELGIEPSSTLQRLEKRILTQDKELEAPPRPQLAQPPVSFAVERKPVDVSFVGLERRVVTLVFTDIAGSTTFGERHDAESLRKVMSRYFEAMRRPLERHGAIVERSIGDAIVGVFGVPAVHEDDALRAARAAVEMRDALTTVNKDFVREYGVEIAARIGVNTGEVIVGGTDADQRLPTGDAVNAARRLERAALPGEVLLGEVTYRLIREAVVAEPASAVHAEGKSQRLAAWRLLRLRPDAPAFTRPSIAPFVGRCQELEELRGAFDRAARDRSAGLVTIVGPPGIGKSRLAHEFVRSLTNDARVLVGRCTAYGEAITYLPLAQIVREIAGADPEPAVNTLLKNDVRGAIASRLIVGAIGAQADAGSPEETAWAFRTLFETLAATRPLVVVLDDIHWAEPTLLDLLEYVVGFSNSVPIMFLCLARPDLVERRPSWAHRRPRNALVSLSRLTDDESEDLVAGLPAAENIAPALRNRIVGLAEGNPLFIEQTLATLADDPDATMPATIQALLAARIDRLEPRERAAMQFASVEGRLFHRGVLAELLPPSVADGLGGILLALARKELLTPDRSLLEGDDGYRFNHVLIRDVAYASMRKELRADLHARLASRLEERAGDEMLEIRAFHLDQAARLLTELDGSAPPELREEAAQVLTKAGHRALSRESYRSARKLLLRAVELAPTLDRRYLAGRAAWRLTDYPAVVVEMGEVATQAEHSGETRLQGRALAALAEAVLYHRADAVTARRYVERAIAVLGDGPPEIRFEPLRIAAQVASWLGDYREFEHWEKQALAAAREAERKDLEVIAVRGLIEESVMRLELAQAAPLLLRALELADESGSPLSRASVRSVKGWFELVKGRPTVAEADYALARDVYAELGNATREAATVMMIGRAAHAQGELDRAEKLLRDSVRTLKDLNDRGSLCEAQRALAMVLVEQGRVDEAEGVALEARETVGAEDRMSVASTKLALGLVRAAQRLDGDAEGLIREAVDDVAMYGLRLFEHWALSHLAAFLRSRGREDEAIVYEARRVALSSSITRLMI